MVTQAGEELRRCWAQPVLRCSLRSNQVAQGSIQLGLKSLKDGDCAPSLGNLLHCFYIPHDEKVSPYV